MLNIHAAKAAAGLIQQLSAVHQDADAVTFTCSGLRNVAEYISFAAAGRQYRQDTAVAELVSQAYVGNQLLLVRTEVHEK